LTTVNAEPYFFMSSSLQSLQETMQQGVRDSEVQAREREVKEGESATDEP